MATLELLQLLKEDIGRKEIEVLLMEQHQAMLDNLHQVK